MYKLFKHFSTRNGKLPKYLLSKFSSHSNASSEKYSWMLLIPFTTFGLGTWQVYRLQWKKEKIRDLEMRSQAEPVSLPEDIFEPGKMKEMEFKRVVVEGRFDHSKEIHLGPRSLNVKNESGGGGFGVRPQSGFQVVTPFILENGSRILVNRGWVPKEQKDSAKRLEGQVEGSVLLSGYVRTNERRPQFTPKIKDSSSSWHYSDVSKMSNVLNTLPLLIEADGNSSVMNGPIGGQTRITLRNEHMQYIITWYSLSAATFYLYYQLRKRPAAMFKAGS